MEEEYLILQNKFREWFRDPVPADLPLSAETDHFKRRRSVNKSVKFLDLLVYGLGGAIIFGSVIGFIIYVLLKLNIFRWHSYNWLIQFSVIFFAMVIGFYITLFKVPRARKREK